MPLRVELNPVEIIRKKRKGGRLTRDELHFLLEGFVSGRIPEYQISAFLMAVYFQKMDFEETAMLTEIMLNSGVVVDLKAVPGVKVDKHSTGGVGDKVSLILAPMVAACGVPVPMISGRGLGHTGGTLDKLESIPGFRTRLSIEEFKSALSDIGVAMIGQTEEIVPADRKLYALRDVTGTVESIPLIAGSILSKKIAEGIDALVLDVKTGRGAFMQSEDDAIELAQTLIAVGRHFGKTTIGFLTDMNQPLGHAVGNWLEVVECIECMQGREVPDLMEVTYTLGGAMLLLAQQAASIEEGIDRSRRAISSGEALRKFKEMVKGQGGDVSIIEHPDRYPVSKFSFEVTGDVSGDIDEIDALEIGFAGIILGAGRMKVDDVVDPRAGIVLRKKVGDSVVPGEVLATLYSDDAKKLEAAAHRVGRAFAVATEPAAQPPLVRAMIDERGVHPWHSA